MTKSVRTITPDTTACTVAKLFADNDIGSAIVVHRESGVMLGIVTESDIMGQVAAGADIGEVQVGTFLSQALISVASDEEIHNAATLMKEHSIQRLPVIDGDELQGMLTTSDLTDYLPRLRNTIRRTRREPARN